MNAAVETPTGTKTEETATATGTAAQQELRAKLEQLAAESCTGTGAYYRHTVPGVVLTDGAVKFAELCEAFWFLDVIASWQIEPEKIPDTDFQVWKIKMTGPQECDITCGDGNDTTRTMQAVGYTDFPLPEGFALWAIPTEGENGHRVIVIMHPREY